MLPSIGGVMRSGQQLLFMQLCWQHILTVISNEIWQSSHQDGDG